MEQAVRNRIQSLLEEVSQLNANDPLVNLDTSQLVLNEKGQLSFPFGSDFSRLYKKADKEFKERGVFSLCAIQGYLEWELKSKSIQTPIHLVPLVVSVNKLNACFELNYQYDAAFINPYLIHSFKGQFDISLPEDLSFDELLSFLNEKGFEDINTAFKAIGNVHHHRFEVIRELEELLNKTINPALGQLLGEEEQTFSKPFDLSSELLFAADPDQMLVYKTFKDSNTVVQGPPGTGKSQVLTNVIANILKSNASAIAVSEKRAALEILQKKLEQYSLQDLSFIVSSETVAKDFINELKKSWNRLEQFIPTREHFLPLSNNYLSQLQYLLDVLNQPHLIGGISYKAFIELTANKKWSDSSYNSDLPSMSHWLSVREKVQLIYNLGIALEIGCFAPSFIQNSPFKTADKTIRAVLEELQALNKTFHIETWSDLHSAMKKAAVCQMFNAEVFRKFENLLIPDTKGQKRFLKLRTKYLKECALKSIYNQELNNWLIPPSALVTQILLEEFAEKTYIKKWRFRKRWQTYSNFPVSHAEELLKQWKKYLVHQEVIAHLEAELIELGLDDIESDLAWIYQQIHQLEASDWKLWMQLSELERNVFSSQNQNLQRLHQQLKSMFRFKDSSKIEIYLGLILEQFSVILKHLAELEGLDEQTLRNLSHYDHFADFENAVFKSNYVQFVSLYPQFSHFDLQDMVHKCDRIITEQNKEAQFFAKEILKKQHKQFSTFHQLLQTSSNKLSADEKIMKQRLKKGKALLVKEFSKTKSFSSLRTLYHSEAQDWIKLLKPIWLSNPAQVAQCFPLESNLFDFAIFDEASQIPLANALGTVYRAEKVLVAGDAQQMGPSSYFKSGSSEPVDLLHQAQYYWKTVALKHHYRSEHPQLIRFSNRYFYGNELHAFPSFSQEKKPINFHYFEQGVFDERSNIHEAKEVAKFIAQNLSTNDSVGIVAFSETQLMEIYKLIPKENRQLLERRIEEGSVFFKSLENVQGDECDRLIISFGYGKTSDGVFNLRFGPLNAKNGHKRLNVLLTRARKRIDFFASVCCSDFKMSSNESVELLRKFFMQLEHDEGIEEASLFPLGLDVEVNQNRLKMPHVYENLRDARELVTVVDVLKNRGWHLDFNIN